MGEAAPAPAVRPRPWPWPANATFGAAGLEVAGVPAGRLVSGYGTPLYVLDEDDFRARCRSFATAFPHVHYAVKALALAAVIRIAAEEGLGFLVASGGELDACLRAGVDPATICFHGNNKSDEELSLAVAERVGLVIADGAEELERLDRVAAIRGATQSVLLRVAPGVVGGTHEYLETGGMASKFGAPIEGGAALAAVEFAIARPNLAFRGIHAHIGSQLLRPEPYFLEIEALFDFLASVRDSTEATADLLDIGGGFGVTYTDESPSDPQELAALIRGRVREAADERGLEAPHLMIEPGRSLAANAVVTLYSVGAVKEVPGGVTFVAVDGGMSDNVRPALYGARYTVALAGPPRESPTVPMTVVGKHCESGDTIAEGVALPRDIRRGDLLALASTGAYAYSMASNYNKVGRPAVVAVRRGSSRLVARREDAADLDRLNVGGPPLPMIASGEGFVVRPARPRDAASFHALWKEIVEEGWVRSQEVRHPVRHYRLLFKRSWTDNGAWIMALAGNEVVGHLAITREEHPVTRHVAELGLGVGSRWRGRGVGGALMSEAFGWAGEHGVEKVELSVYPDNVPAIRLYRRFGFVEEGRSRKRSKKRGGYRDEILMARWLD